MADRRKTITLSIGDDFSRQLTQFARQVDQADDSLDSMSNSAGKVGLSFRGMLTNVRDMTMAFNGMVTMVTTVAKGVDDFARYGTAARQNRIALEKLSGSTQAYEANVRAVQSALKGAVTESEAAAIASNLLNLGLAKDAASIEEFTRISNVIAAMSPQLADADAAVNQIGLTIANMSFMRLDALGLSVRDVKDRMAELMEENANMTKEVAFGEAVMEGLAEKADVLGDEFTEVGGSQDRMRARLRGLKEFLAIHVSEGLDAAFLSAETLATQLNMMDGKDIKFSIIMDLITLSAGSVSSATIDQAQGLAGQVAGVTLGLVNSAIADAVLGVAPDPDQLIAPTIASDPFNQSANQTAVPMPATAGQMISGGVQAGQIAPTLFNFGSQLPFQVTRPPTQPTAPFSGPGFTGDLEQIMASQTMQPMTTPGFDPSLSFQPMAQSANDAKDEIRGIMNELNDMPVESSGIWGDAFVSIGDVIEGGMDKGKEAGLDFLGTLVEIAKEANNFESLAEKFELSGDSFDTDVLNEMNSALREAGVEADVATAAIERYQLATGLATGASQIFEGQMAGLAEDLADGTINADQFAAQAEALAAMDFSGASDTIAQMLDAGRIEQASDLIDILVNKDFADLEQTLAGFQAVVPEGDQPAAPQDLIDSEPALEELSIMEQATQEWVDRMDLMLAPVEGAGLSDHFQIPVFEEDIKTASEEAEQAVADMAMAMITEGGTLESGFADNFNNMASVGTTSAKRIGQEFGAQTIEIVDDIKSIDHNLDQLFLKQRKVQFTLQMQSTIGEAPSSSSPSAGSLPTFAEGGFTGRGSNPFLAMLHPNELVIPLNKIPTSGGRDSGEPIVVELFIDGRHVEASVANVKRLKNEAF